ncbi:MAG TPA: hypothetical protein VF092_20245 [Longimicrobium sp.]
MRLGNIIPLAVVAAAAACSDGGSPTAPANAPAPPAAVVGSALSGAIFTTDVACNGTDLNIYGDRHDVWLDGGPTHPGAATLPDGAYYVRVTNPSGALLLGTSVGAADETPFTVTGGVVSCINLWNSLITPASTQGFDPTDNPGGEYKVWVSTDNTFTNSSTKTDNFKVKEDEPQPLPTWLRVRKFYDANANGIDDDGQPIIGWRMRIADGFDEIHYTPVDMQVAPDDYTVTESAPVETNWLATTANPVAVTLAAGDDRTVTFGNLCVGAGGGLTLGFWSNKNGQALMDGTDLAMLSALNLRNAAGAGFDPGTYASFRTWILGATATNMAYMLSAQLAAMELNVFNGKVAGSSLIYAPGATSANSLGFATVSAVMAEADTELGLHGVTTDGSPFRAYQEALKNALDKANNNLSFVQATPCAFSFGA